MCMLLAELVRTRCIVAVEGGEKLAAKITKITQITPFIDYEDHSASGLSRHAAVGGDRWRGV
jgi:hypothetical protein